MRWLLLLLLVPVAGAIEVAPGWTVVDLGITDVDASVGRWSHATARHGDLHFFIYHGAATPATVYVTAYDAARDRLWEPVAVGASGDDHGHPSLVIDSQGYLHVTFGGHVKPGTPLVHRVSSQPLDIRAWDPPTVLDRTANSAYTLLSIDDDRLHLVYRRGGATHLGNGDLVHRTWHAGTWQPLQVLVDHPTWSIYPSDLLVRDGNVHIAFHVRDFGASVGLPATVHQVGGAWQTLAGEPLQLPIGPEQASLLDGLQVPDGWPAPQLAHDGRLAVLYARGSHLDAPQEIRLARPLDGEWASTWLGEGGFRARSLLSLEGRLQFLSVAWPEPNAILLHDEAQRFEPQPVVWDDTARFGRPVLDRGRSVADATINQMHGFFIVFEEGNTGRLHFLAGPLVAADQEAPAPWIAPLVVVACAAWVRKASAAKESGSGPKRPRFDSARGVRLRRSHA